MSYDLWRAKQGPFVFCMHSKSIVTKSTKETIKFHWKLYRLVLYLMFFVLLQTRNSKKKKRAWVSFEPTAYNHLLHKKPASAQTTGPCCHWTTYWVKWIHLKHFPCRTPCLKLVELYFRKISLNKYFKGISHYFRVYSFLSLTADWCTRLFSSSLVELYKFQVAILTTVQFWL